MKVIHIGGIMKGCNICPRECSADRGSDKKGFCGEGDTVAVSRIGLHMWEEPSISGTRGSGTIFFRGCNLRCVFCQNKLISRGGGAYRELDSKSLAREMLALRDMGAHNINLVTPTHFAPRIAESLSLVKCELGIPVVYNSSGYESVDTLKMLDGLIDIYMPDFKYASAKLSAEYSNAPDYPKVAVAALTEMFRQLGENAFDDEGIMQKGLIVRHLVLPACRADSIAVLDTLCRILPKDKFKLSLMSQYTPEFAADCEFKNLHRRVTSFEYDSVLKYAISLGLDGYFQSRTSANSAYTPDFEE